MYVFLIFDLKYFAIPLANIMQYAVIVSIDDVI